MTFDTVQFLSTLALVAAVILISALLSGIIDRSRFPQVAVYLGMGAIIGPYGLSILDVSASSPTLRVLATLSLALVLFTDALSLNVSEIARHRTLTIRVLGPGTLASALIVAGAAFYLLGLRPAFAAILGAALASTDPVLLRGILRRSNLSGKVRQALRLESGLNDAVLLPVVLVAVAYLSAGEEPVKWAHLGMNLLVLSPAAGAAVALFAVASLDLVQKRFGVRRDYESLYSLGVAFAAFAAAESLHGSGFLAAFAAGLTIVALNVELCDCFLEYGETTAEMMLLLTFVVFGCSLIWTGFDVLNWRTFLFAVLVLLARPAAFLPSLAGASLRWRERAFIAWFGPRGLSSLLLALLPLFAGIEGSTYLLQIVCLVVLLSVVVHGGTSMFLPDGERAPADAAPTERVGEKAVSPSTRESRLRIAAEVNGRGANGSAVVAAAEHVGSGADSPHSGALFIDAPAVQALMDSSAPYKIVDVRRDDAYGNSPLAAKEAIHANRNNVVEKLRLSGLRTPSDATIVTFCSCPKDEAALQAAEELRRKGFKKSFALRDGWNSWLENKLPTVPKELS